MVTRLILTAHPKPITSPSTLLPSLSSSHPFHSTLLGRPLSFSGASLGLAADPNPLNNVVATKKTRPNTRREEWFSYSLYSHGWIRETTETVSRMVLPKIMIDRSAARKLLRS